MPIFSDPTRPAPAPWWKHLLAGLLYGVLVAAAFPPASAWPLTLFSLAPLVWSAFHPGRRPWISALMVALGSLPLWIFQERWLLDVTEIGYPLLALYLCLYPGVFVWLTSFVSRRLERAGFEIPAALIVPILWVGLEFLRGEIGLTGYAWFLVAHPLIEIPILAAPAALLGTYFVSFLVASLSGALADATGWTPAPRGIGGLAASLVVVCWGITGLIGLAPIGTGPDIRIGLVQTNIPQDNKMKWTLEQRERDLEEFCRLTRDAASQRPAPDLICWPETMFPGYALNSDFRDDLLRVGRELKAELGKGDLAMVRRLEELQREIGVPLLVGAQSVEGFRIVPGVDGRTITDFDDRYNSAYIVENGSVRAERYDKIELTPFGEVIPYLWRWKSLQAMIERLGAGGMKFDLTPGKHAASLPLDLKSSGTTAPKPGEPTRATGLKINLVTPICFEATKARLCRDLVLAAREQQPGRPIVIVNMSNDGWFSSWSGRREQHLQAARWRSVELGLPMVRAVNTGISCFIDARGNVRRTGFEGRELRVRSEGVLVDLTRLPSPSRSTLYVRIGEVFGWGMLGAAALLPCVSMLLSRRSRSNRSSLSA